MDTLNNNLDALRLARAEDSDAEDYEEKQQYSTTQEPERAHSHENNGALAKKNQEIERLKN